MPDIEETVRRLSALDCCALSDALDSLHLEGAVTGLAQRSGEGRIAGIAVTFKVAPGDPPPGPPRHLGTAAIAASDGHSIIVVEQRSGVEAGCWGGLLTRGALVQGVRGVVADGPVRDIDEARELNFPIFTNRTTSFTARGRVVDQGTNLDIAVGSATVSPGDFVVADNSAVIFIKPDDVERVLVAAEAIAAREAAMVAAIEAGTPIGEVMSGAYEHMLSEPLK
ncbi:RraA family protein [Parasphingopyxis marina]|uniref:Putative 4-hydroxy-4-methyl-2-oxoglutarate aldolase n=1 Tax=Parasphingopyxis marina TaxID=2761622 RepID=A0A842HVD8_9SPHN|nr:RraA family protein [Parasphingopyxis marina]MBC2777056.1 RraA family protein [Parasphingopyxis marina]